MRRGRKRNANRKSTDELRTFGRLLKAARERTGRTQRDLAGELGINIITLSKYETGLSPVPEARARELARVLKAPELVSTAESAGPRREVDTRGAAADRAPAGDLLASRKKLSEWWVDRQSKLFHKDGVGLDRIGELRDDIVSHVTGLLRKEHISIEDQSDKALIESLELELSTILANRNRHRPPITTAA